jgi:ATP synthase protein I
MAGPSSHRGEMSQDSLMPSVHPTNVRRPVADPAARTGKRAYNALNASSVGLELGLCVALGLLAGFYLDKYLGTTPWMLLLWMVLGVVAGFRGVFRAIKRADRAAAEESHPLGSLGEVATTGAPRG